VPAAERAAQDIVDVDIRACPNAESQGVVSGWLAQAISRELWE
jgi:hypothetical protein